MSTFRIALANLQFPETPEESVVLAEQAIAQASLERAGLICFPECYIPGYRGMGKRVPAPDPVFLERAWSAVRAAAAKANLTVILGTERVADGGLVITALVINRDGTIAGFQDKVQLDPSEESTYSPGCGRRVFQAGALTFGIVICHEGWRYPETVRWAARRGAHVVFHPHFHEAEPGGYRPSSFADPANSFHEKAVLCRAAENTCFFATVNCASEGSPTTSAIVRPNGALLTYQPYGKHGLLIADIDITEATGLFATRLSDVLISNVIILLFGPPGCGKGTQAAHLAQQLKIPAISTGEMFRAECQAGTELGKLACSIMASGGLVGDEIVNGIVASRISRPDCANGLLLDGYPRTVPQARYLASLIRERGLPEPIVIHLHVSDEALVTRLTARRQCPECRRIYNLLSQPPRKAGECDDDGAPLLTRDDDQEAVIRRRLRAYREQTGPVLEWYGKSVVQTVDGAASPEEVGRAIERVVLQLTC